MQFLNMQYIPIMNNLHQEDVGLRPKILILKFKGFEIFILRYVSPKLPMHESEQNASFSCSHPSPTLQANN